MSDHLTPAQTNFVWDQFRAGGHNGLSDAQVEALFETIRRLRAERRVTKGLHAKIDKQAESIQRVRVLANSWMLEQDDTEYTEPELLALDNAAHEIIDALNGGCRE